MSLNGRTQCRIRIDWGGGGGGGALIQTLDKGGGGLHHWDNTYKNEIVEVKVTS